MEVKPPKFRNGDIVLNIWGHKVRVLRSFGKNKEIYYETEDCLSGATDDYREESLSFDYEHLQEEVKDFVPEKKECPKCSSPWSITGFGKRKWYDCKTCKKSAEELCNENDKPPKFNVKNSPWWTD